MRKILVFASVLLVLLACVSCAEKTENKASDESAETTEVQTEPAKLVSREYFLEHCGYTEEELEGVDIDWFIEYYGVTEDDFSTPSLRTHLDSQIAFANPVIDYREEYQYLHDRPLSKYEADMTDVIKLLYVKNEHEGYTREYLFDFEKGRVCGYNDVYVRDIKEDDMEKLRKLIRESGIENITETYITGKKEKYQEYIDSYELYVETEDGRTAHIKGDHAIPEEFKKLAGLNCEKIEGIAERGEE